MYCMFGTPDVSKLSGWLNASASCRESQREGIDEGAAGGQETGECEGAVA